MSLTAPTLIIGIGGIGAEITALLEKRSGGNKDNQQFLIVDTDINAIRERISKGFAGETIQMSENMTVEKCLAQLPQSAEWYPKMDFYNYKSMSEGAGQVRVISRLAFESALKNNKFEPVLRTIMDRLHCLGDQDEGQQMRILIVSTLAGGTGSGAVLPLAIYLRQYMRRNYPVSEVNIKGFFLMPDILDSVVGGYRERISIYANAYATIKELTAFMRKADDLADNSSELRMRLTGEGDGCQEKTSNSSYNYCFLIGKRNENDWNLKSFNDYKGLVADGIYMQALSPVQDLINSREDNLMKSLIVQVMEQPEKGLPHFGGMGFARLRYPYSQLRSSLALQWALAIMKMNWNFYDKSYRRYREETNERIARGGRVGSKDFGDFFVEEIDKNKETNPEAARVYGYFRPDNSRTTVWEQYLSSLREHMECLFEENDRRDIVSELNSGDKNSRVSNNNKKLKQQNREYAKKQFGEYYRAAPELEDAVLKSMKSVISSPNQMQGGEPYLLKTWLYSGNRFADPNTLRYFLYSLQKEIKKQTEKMRRSASPEQWEDIVSGKIDIGKRPYEELLKDYQDDLKKTIWKACQEELQKYLQKIGSKYEDFFERYEELLEKLRKDQEELNKELDEKKGKTDIFVGCKKQQRANCIETMKNLRCYEDSEGQISEMIYCEIIHELSGEKTVDWCGEIRQFWEKLFEKNYGEQYNLDIIQAIMVEGELLGRDPEQYVKDKLAAARENQTKPFLRLMGSHNKHRIASCCYNRELECHEDKLKEIVKEELEKTNGRAAENPDRYTIMFYQSFFGVSPDEIIELLHMSGRDVPYCDGVYFDAYRYMIDHLILDEELMPMLTPHIDKHWHLPNVMGDIDPDYQHKWECGMYDCFVMALIFQVIKEGGSPKYILELKLGEEIVHHDFALLKDAFALFCKRKDIKDGVGKLYKEIMDEDCKNGVRNFGDSQIFKKAVSTKIFEQITSYILELSDAEYDRNTLYNLLSALERVSEDSARVYEKKGTKGIQRLWNEFKTTHKDSMLVSQNPAVDLRTESVRGDFFNQMKLMGIQM